MLWMKSITQSAGVERVVTATPTRRQSLVHNFRNCGSREICYEKNKFTAKLIVTGVSGKRRNNKMEPVAVVFT